jgi:glycosyltransferase involved in cell wall biosynthesis
VLFLDHSAQLSGAEIGLLRLLAHLDGVDATVVVFEHGPLVEELHRAGIDLRVVAMPERARALRRDDVRPGRVPAAAVTGTASQVLRVARTLHRVKPDLVHAYSLKAGVVALAATRLVRVPLVWHFHDRIDSGYLPRSALRSVRVLASRFPAAVVANSQSTMATLPPPRARSQARIVLPCPYDPPPRIHERRASGELRVGMLGRISEWKGQHVALEAFARAFPTGGGTLTVIGAPLFGEEAYRDSLLALSKRLGVDDRVCFAGYVHPVEPVLADLDVLVHASVIPEPFGQVVVEGLAAGLAVVASRAGGPAEIITDGENGLLVAPGDVDALAGALRGLAASPELRRRLGDSGRRRAEDFTSSRVTYRLLDLYERVLTSGVR